MEPVAGYCTGEFGKELTVANMSYGVVMLERVTCKIKILCVQSVSVRHALNLQH